MKDSSLDIKSACVVNNNVIISFLESTFIKSCILISTHLHEFIWIVVGVAFDDDFSSSMNLPGVSIRKFTSLLLLPLRAPRPGALDDVPNRANVSNNHASMRRQ